MDAMLTEIDEEHDCDVSKHDVANRSVHRKWADNGFIKPLRVLIELSGFNNITFLYKILVSIAVTSCSAERAMSRIRIVKNSMRSTMLDDMVFFINGYGIRERCSQ